MTYVGGKGGAGVAQTIINQQPPHTSYIEPFLGGGSVMLAKRPAAFNLGIDLDPDPIDNFAGAARLDHIFYCQCGIAFLETDARALEPAALIYCDPPYPFGARRRNRRLYRCELNDVDHRRILRAIQDLRCMVQISSYWNPLYAEILEGWRLVRFMAQTRGGMMEECLWMNYPEPAALHDYRFLGANFRQRERIKRKTDRWVKRIASLPQIERTALFSAMSAALAENGAPGSRGVSGEPRRRIPAASTMSAIIDRAAPLQEMTT